MPLSARALLACFLVLAASSAAAATVTGTVTDAATHLPLGGMTVAAYDTAGALRGTATTDAAGLYVLTVPAGEYRVLAYDLSGTYATMFDANAESFETSPLRTVLNSPALTVHFALVRGGSIAGNVGTLNGIARPGATVEAYNLSGTRRGFTTADALGNYTLILPPGDYKLVAFDANAAALFYREARSFADATPVHVTASVTTSGITFRIPTAARVSGTARDQHSHAPLANIDVYAYTPEGALVGRTTTNANGAFTLSLPPGAYRFVAADASGNYATAFFDASHAFANARIETLASGEQRNLEIALVRSARIRGTVNAPGLVISAYNLDGTLHATATSDASGQYMLVVAPGVYKLAFSDPSLTYATEFHRDTIDFRAAARVFAAVDLSGIDATLQRGGRVSGTTQAGMNVAAYDESGALIASTTAAADGRYTLVLAPGAYRLLAYDPALNYATSYAGGASTFESTALTHVVADQTVTVDFAMQPGVRQTGVVRNLNGTPLAGIEVFALDVAGNRVAAGVSRSDGTFTIVLLSGAYRFQAVDPTGRYASSEVTPTVSISLGQIPSPLTFTLELASRRRAARH